MATSLWMKPLLFPMLESGRNSTWGVGRPGGVADNDQLAEGFAVAVVEFRRQRRITRNAAPLFDNG